MILLDDIESIDGQKALDVFEKIAKENLEGKILTTFVDVESEDGRSLADWAGAGHGGYPEMFIVDAPKD